MEKDGESVLKLTRQLGSETIDVYISADAEDLGDEDEMMEDDEDSKEKDEDDEVFF